MMGRQSRQMAMIFVDIASLIPEKHLLRKVDRMVSYDFNYDLLAPIIHRLAAHMSTLSVCSKCS